MKKAQLILALGLALLLTVWPVAALAASPEAPRGDDRIIAGGTFTLAAGETHYGSLLVLGGVVSLEEGSRLVGDIVILGGTVTVEGEITGSMIAIGGVVRLTATVLIQGDLIAPGSVVTRDPAAVVEGQIITQFVAPQRPASPAVPPVPDVPSVPDVPALPSAPAAPAPLEALGVVFSPLVQGFWFLLRAMVFAALAVVVSVFMPAHIQHTRAALVGQPLVSGGLGLLVLLALMPVAFFLGITILLLPVAALLVLAVGVAVLFGWVALGDEIGQRVGLAFRQTWSPAAQVGVGTFVLTFLAGSLGAVFVEFFGALVTFLLAALGLGGVVLTRFGTRAYVSSLTEGSETGA